MGITGTDHGFWAGEHPEHPHKSVGRPLLFNKTPVREYTLSYDNQGAAGSSRLVSVQECAGDGSCFKPLEFRWAGDGNVPVFDTPLSTR